MLSVTQKTVLAVSLMGGIWTSAMLAADSPSKRSTRTAALVIGDSFTIRAAASASSTLTITPGVVSFNATNPATNPVVPGATPLQADLVIVSPRRQRTWSLTVSAQGTTLNSASSTIPIGAVTWTATGKVLGGNGSANATAGSQTLSTTSRVVASGTEGSTNPFHANVTVNYNFGDSWDYEVGSYSQMITYTMVAQ